MERHDCRDDAPAFAHVDIGVACCGVNTAWRDCLAVMVQYRPAPVQPTTTADVVTAPTAVVSATAAQRDGDAGDVQLLQTVLAPMSSSLRAFADVAEVMKPPCFLYRRRV